MLLPSLVASTYSGSRPAPHSSVCSRMFSPSSQRFQMILSPALIVSSCSVTLNSSSLPSQLQTGCLILGCFSGPLSLLQSLQRSLSTIQTALLHKRPSPRPPCHGACYFFPLGFSYPRHPSRPSPEFSSWPLVRVHGPCSPVLNPEPATN